MTDRTSSQPSARHLWMAAAVAWLLVVAWAAAAIGTGYVPARLDDLPDATAVASPGEDVAPAAVPADLRRRARTLTSRLARTEPKGAYIVIDRTHNRLSLRKGGDTVLLAVCSAGSGATLTAPDGTREWTFATPRGRFQVLSKLRNPVWKKPDWAFIEEGLPVPENAGDRFEYGVLGEYALYFGDGYMIHGTLYERLLGRSVSHGCVRLGRDDLRALYAETRVGTPIYIY